MPTSKELKLIFDGFKARSNSKKQHWAINADTELSRLRQRLVKDVVNSWCYIALRPHIPFCYLAACIHETSLSETHLEDLLYMIDLLDKQFLLLRVRHNCLYAEDLVTSKPGEVHSFIKFWSFDDRLQNARIMILET
ncbi:hypothetical protein F4776DRAFT_674685 [Hypoxylon sp. NC0597]|nr:hypothetical protein F4776DRAFT_674685 [Hypoxylon sp. NC0597]